MGSGSTAIVTPLIGDDIEAAIDAAKAAARTEAIARLGGDDVRLNEMHTIEGGRLATNWTRIWTDPVVSTGNGVAGNPTIVLANNPTASAKGTKPAAKRRKPEGA